MLRVLTIWIGATLVALICGLPSSAGDRNNEAGAPSVKNLRLKVSPNGRYFVDQDGKVLPRDVIFDRVWGYDFGPASNSLEVYVGYLRRKTEAGGEPRLVQTVRGVGYVLRCSPR